MSLPMVILTDNIILYPGKHGIYGLDTPHGT